MKPTNTNAHTNPCILCPIGIEDPSLCRGCAYNTKDEKGKGVKITIITIVEV